MKKYKPIIIVLALLFVAFIVYNRQLASIPLLLLSIYLFYLTFREMKRLKNKK